MNERLERMSASRIAFTYPFAGMQTWGRLADGNSLMARMKMLFGQGWAWFLGCRCAKSVGRKTTMIELTYWNGEKTPARKVLVTVGKSMADTWWCADLEGTTRKAVEVSYGQETFFLDDEVGQGWAKVTEGHGSPSYAHNSLPDNSTVIADLGDNK